MLSALLAGVGGLLPSVSRIAASLAVQPEQPLPHWHILIALALFFAMGFVLNFAMNKENDLTKAVIVGISAPALITNIVAGVSNAPPPISPSPTTVGFSFVTEAFADQRSGVAPLAGTQVIFGSSFAGSYGFPGAVDTPVMISAGSANGPLKPVATVPAGSEQTFTLPAGATLIAVRSGTAEARASVPAGTSRVLLRATLVVETTLGGDLAWAFGAKRVGSVKEIRLSLMRMP